jgi:hypothetical protein
MGANFRDVPMPFQYQLSTGPSMARHTTEIASVDDLWVGATGLHVQPGVCAGMQFDHFSS